MDKTAPLSASAVSLRHIGAAPHRLMFFIGASNLMLAMAWWAAWLAAARWPALTMHQPQPYAGWLHAFVMQYQMLPSFMFGFLLTTFPKWMGLPDIERWRYAPVGVGLFGGQIATLLGALGWEAGIVVGLLLTIAGWLGGLMTLGPMLWRENGATWHARSCFAALALGFAGVLAWAAFVLLGASPLWAFASIKLGSFGLLLPVYLTVAHRMFPFFAGRVVPGYQPWRPLWLLAAFWALCMGHLALELLHAYGWLWLFDLPLLALTATMVWRWWPTDRDVLVPRAQDALERPTDREVLVPRAGATGILPPASLVHPSTSHDAQERPTDRDALVPRAGATGVLPPASLVQPSTSKVTLQPPRGTKPALLTVLFVGLAWLPIAFALYSAQSVAYSQTGVFWLGRAPAHALFIGFFGSVLVAMVTRVTQGHAGRPLELSRPAWFAFVAIQIVTVLRIAAELATDAMLWQSLAALGWLLALGPWVVWLGRIYLSPRVDGKAG